MSSVVAGREQPEANGRRERAAARWNIAAPFFDAADSTWLDDFVRNEAIVFTKIPPPSSGVGSWHRGRSKQTRAVQWLSYFAQARAAFRSEPQGIVTCFPQLALCAGLIKKLTGSKVRLVAYNFNIGALAGGPRRFFARWAASEIDRFVVHSPTEIPIYADYLGVPRDRLVFVPLQMGEIDVVRLEDREQPFILAMGSAHRDYPTLIEAADRCGIPTVIVTRQSDAEALPKSPLVTFLSGLTQRECLELLARARLSVTPIRNLTTASGQVTIVDAMRMGVAVIATRCPGTDGYINDGETGLLVEPFDVDGLSAAIARLWDNPAEREKLAVAAKADASQRMSDEAAARQLEAVVLSLT